MGASHPIIRTAQRSHSRKGIRALPGTNAECIGLDGATPHPHSKDFQLPHPTFPFSLDKLANDVPILRCVGDEHVKRGVIE